MLFAKREITRISKGSMALSAVALLLSAGFATPANAAVGVPFTPTLTLTADAYAVEGMDYTVDVTIGAAAGEEWTDTPAGTDVPLTVRVDVYGTYATGTVPAESATPPAGTSPLSTQTFFIASGPSTYTFDVEGTSNPSGQYVFVASVLQADGTNDPSINNDVSTAFASPSSITEVLANTPPAPAPVEPTPAPTPTGPAPVPAGPPPGATVPSAPEPTTPTDPVTTSPIVSSPVGAGNGTGGGAPEPMFDNCDEARAAGFEDIATGTPEYSTNLDSDGDGVGCETDGSDAAVAIDGGFAQASESSNVNPALIGGGAMVLAAFVLGGVALVRRRNTVK